MVAPTEKGSPSFEITSAFQALPSIIPMALRSRRRIASSSAFILLVNSRQSTPSPRSQRAADEFFATGFEARLTSASSSTPSPRGTSEKEASSK